MNKFPGFQENVQKKPESPRFFRKLLVHAAQMLPLQSANPYPEVTDLAYHVFGLGVPAGPEPLLQEPARACGIIFYKALSTSSPLLSG